jgi:ABC-type phosphate/phosphonate transport system substrate-binding protein
MNHFQIAIALAILCRAILASETPSATAQKGPAEVIRIGHFPNITHAQALIAHQMSRSGNGWFEKRLGRDIDIQWFLYNAGPAAIEAILAGSIDVTYAGPSPAVNAYVRSNGNEIRDGRDRNVGKVLVKFVCWGNADESEKETRTTWRLRIRTAWNGMTNSASWVSLTSPPACL